MSAENRPFNLFSRRSSLAGRLLAALTLVALISVVGLGVAAFGEERSALKGQLSDQLTSVADLKKEQIVMWLNERQSDARLLAVNKLNQEHLTELLIPSVPVQRKQEFASFLTDNLMGMQGARTGYSRIVIADTDGRIIIATDENLIGQSIVGREMYSGLLSSADGTYIHDIHLESSSGEIEMAFGHIMFAVDPVTFEELPEIIGMVIISVNMDETIYPLIRAWPGMGDTGETLLVRAEGANTLFLNNLRFDETAALNLVVPSDSENAKPAHYSAVGQEGIIETPDYRGVPVLAAYRHIPGINWGFVAKEDLDEVFALANLLAVRIGLIAMVVFVVAGLVSIRLARTLSQPLVQLVDAANAVAAGNLKTQIAIDRRDEIGLLAQSFQTMTYSLEQRQAEVEEATWAIQERTKELEALAELSAALRKAEGIDEMLPVFLEKAVGCVDAQSGVIFLVDLATGDLVARDCLPRRDVYLGGRHKLGHGVTGQVAASGELLILEDISQSKQIERLPGEAELLATVVSAISMPLRTRERTVGVMHIGFSERHQFNDEEVRLLTAMAEIAGSALHRAIVLQSLEARVEARTLELGQVNERLQELDRLKSKFVSDVSHELRTPVANLTLYLDLLERKAERVDRYLPRLKEQTKRLGQLIEDILNLSRLESKAKRPTFDRVDMNGLIAQIAETYRPQIEGNGLALTVRLTESLPLVWGDYNQLAQVVTNLLANAINFTPQGTILLSTVHGNERGVIFQVRDSGIGIEAEDMSHLFERFYRGRQTSEREIPGTGLGLGIVKEIVEMHDGRIEVQSVVGQGSTFEIWLPEGGERGARIGDRNGVQAYRHSEHVV